MFVGMYLLGRRHCVGGQSIIYPNDNQDNSTTLLLSESGDSLIIDDRRVQHEMTPISSGTRLGSRDMMILDFEPTSGE